MFALNIRPENQGIHCPFPQNCHSRRGIAHAPQVGQEAMHAQTGVDLVTGQRSKVATVFGRPKWDKIFADIKERHPGKRVGVFVCGPKARHAWFSVSPKP